MNITTIRSPAKIQLLRETIRATEVDFAFLQEVRTNALPDFYGYTTYVTPGGPVDRGVAILVRDGIDVTDITYLPSARGIALTALDTRFINVYAPSGTTRRHDRATFYSTEVAPLFLGRYEHTVFAGDFNCVLKPQDQIPHYTPCPELGKVIQELHLCDTWEKVHGDRPGFTYLTSHSASRLDRIYVSQGLRQGVVDAERWPQAHSDHSAYICTIHLHPQDVWRSTGLWKLNVSHLQDPDCRLQVAATWANCERRHARYPTTLEWWLFCAKPAIRRTLMQFGKEKAAWHRRTLDFYYAALRDLDAMPPSPETQQERHRIKAHILSLTKRRLDGAAVRSRRNDLLASEVTTMHHITADKRRQRHRLITRLTTQDGHTCTTQATIVKAMEDHFRRLYQEGNVDNEATAEVLDQLTSTIDMTTMTALMEEVSSEEVEEALSKGAINKSPGLDGIPVEFYRSFRDLMMPRWVTMFRELMSPTCSVPPCFVEGLLIPVHKPKAGISINDYRPLTMLNADYKIFARLLASRIKTTLPMILAPEQTSQGGEANIQMATGDCRDLIAIASACHLRAAIVSIDFDRAFDRVEHSFLLQVMERMGFPPSFVDILRRLLAVARSQVQVNGRTVGPIPIKRSIRQGCPLSTYLYAIALEPLLRGLTHRLSGLTLRDVTFRYRAYADDLLLLVRSSDEVRRVLHWIERYGQAAGSLLNINKSAALDIGRGLGPDAVAPLPTVTELRYLGVTFTKDVRRTTAMNYRRLLQTIRVLVRQNLLRELNQLQRVEYLNVYLASKLNHVAQVLPLPAEIGNRLQAAFGYYVSMGRVFKVRYDTLTLPLRDGGLGLVNVRARATALYINNMRRRWTSQHPSLTGRLLDVLMPASQVPQVSVAHVATQLSHISNFILEYSHAISYLPTTRPPKAKDFYNILLRAVSRNVIETKYPTVDWPRVWITIHHDFLPKAARATWYQVTNRKYPTRHRLHAIGLTDSPLCPDCGLLDTDEHRLTCESTSSVWRLAQKIIACYLRVTPDMIDPRIFLSPDDYYFPSAKYHAITWFKAMTIDYMFGGGEKVDLDYWWYLRNAHHALERTPKYRKLFANYLRSVFVNPPLSWGVSGYV